jgi:hypothetical protein
MVISRVSSSGSTASSSSSSSSHAVIYTHMYVESFSIRRIVQQQYNHQPGIEQEKEKKEGIRLKVLQQIIHAYA